MDADVVVVAAVVVVVVVVDSLVAVAECLRCLICVLWYRYFVAFADNAA